MWVLPPDTHGGTTCLMSAPTSEGPARGWLWRVTLSSIFLETYFKCFFLVFLFFVVFPTLTALGSMVQAQDKTDNPVKGEPNKQDCTGPGQGMGCNAQAPRDLSAL